MTCTMPTAAPTIDTAAANLVLSGRVAPMLDPFIAGLVIEACGWLFDCAWSASCAGMTVPAVIAQRLAVELEAQAGFRAQLAAAGFRKPVVPASKPRKPTAAERQAARVAQWYGPRPLLPFEVA